MFKVSKKDGSLQDFDRSKIVAGVIKAGGSLDEAEKVATGVEAWAEGAAVDGAIKSSDLRTKGLEILQDLNSQAAGNFEAYKKS